MSFSAKPGMYVWRIQTTSGGLPATEAAMNFWMKSGTPWMSSIFTSGVSWTYCWVMSCIRVPSAPPRIDQNCSVAGSLTRTGPPSLPPCPPGVQAAKRRPGQDGAAGGAERPPTARPARPLPLPSPRAHRCDRPVALPPAARAFVPGVLAACPQPSAPVHRRQPSFAVR